MGPSPRAGWYLDPGDGRGLRYWDGTGWTSQVAAAPSAGWYQDPADSNVLRYWGGTGWTTNVTMTAAATVVEAPSAPVAPSEVDAARAAAARAAGTPAAVAPLEAVSSSGERDGSTQESTRGSQRPGWSASVRRFGLVLLVATLLIALGLGGYIVMQGSGQHASPPSTGVPPVQTPPGYHVVTLRSAGLSLAVRDTWLALDPTSSTVTEAVQRVAAANPQLASTLAEFGTEASNVKFLAADAGNPIYSSNVEISALGLSKAALSDWRGAQAALRKQIPNAEVHPATIAGVSGLELTGTVSLRHPTGSLLTIHATGYLVSSSAGVVSIMFGTTDDGSQDPDVRTAIRTLRLRQ